MNSELPDTEHIGKLNPMWITGFIDAEGCFMMAIRKNIKCLIGYSVQVVFQVELHKKDRAILELIKSTLGVGIITDKKTRATVNYTVSCIRDLKVVIAHFDKYPLITKKWADYQLFKRAFYILESKEHLRNPEGFKNLLAIKNSMNKGLSDPLKVALSDATPVERPLVLNQAVLDPNWLAGFTAGEGCFYVNLIKSPRSKLGESVQLRFQITQHIRDKQLLESVAKYLECGGYSASAKDVDWGKFLVTTFEDITSKIVPFFDQYPLQGVKSKDFEEFKKIVRLMEERVHLTSEGLEQIRKIKVRMNKGRELE